MPNYSVNSLPYLDAAQFQFVSHPNYILIYRVTTVAVEILNVVHSRQQYP